MKIKTRLTDLFNIELPIVQGGMVWVSGWKLASAVSENGGLGLIGAGSMKPELLKEHIRKCKAATSKPFGVNLPLLRSDADELVRVILDENIRIVFTSAGHPGKFIEKFKNNGAVVVHVVSSVKHALKAESVGCDAIVGEGFEAGGHNGPDEITTFALIPQIADAVKIPVIAAGGIADGRGIIAALALGAEGVQIGTRFAATRESSAHQNFKRKILEARDNSTTIILRRTGFARVIKNDFSRLAAEEEANAPNDLQRLIRLSDKREKLGIFEGDENNGMLEAGEAAGLINELLSVKELFGKFKNEIISEFERLKNSINTEN